MATGPLSQAFSDLAQRMRDDRTCEEALRGVLQAWATAVNERIPEGQRPAGMPADQQRPHLKGRARFEMISPRHGYLFIPSPGGYSARGTPAHPVRPKPGRMGRNNRPAALRFQSGGGAVYRRGVQIPARAPQTFVEEAWRSPEVQRAIAALPGVLVRRS